MEKKKLNSLYNVEDIGSEKRCKFCSLTDSFEPLFHHPCVTCKGYVHVKCFNDDRKRLRILHYADPSNRAVFFEDFFSGVNLSLLYNVNNLSHDSWIHRYLPYQRCMSCDGIYKVINHRSKSRKSYLGGKLLMLPVVLHYSLYVPFMVFFVTFRSTHLVVEFRVFDMLIFFLIIIVLIIPLHFVLILMELNFYNRKLCEYYKPHGVGLVTTKKEEIDLEELDFEIHCFGACEDVIINIFSFLTVRELVLDVSLVCQHFNIIINFPREGRLDVKLISRFFGMHTHLWKIILSRRRDDSFTDRNYESIKSNVSLKDVYMSSFMENSNFGVCQLCFESVTLQQKLDKEVLTHYCVNNCKSPVHRRCLDTVVRKSTKTKDLSFPTNPLYLYISRCLNFVLWTEVDHKDCAHKNLKYTTCLCGGHFPNMKKKKKFWSFSPILLASITSLGWWIVFALEFLVNLLLVFENFAFCRSVWKNGFRKGFLLGTKHEYEGFYSFFKYVFLGKFALLIVFSCFSFLFLIISVSSWLRNYNDLMAATYLVHDIDKKREFEKENKKLERLYSLRRRRRKERRNTV